MTRIGVFCGSSAGNRPAFREAAVDLARALGRHGLGLVYGSARVGLMGVLADIMPPLMVELAAGSSRCRAATEPSRNSVRS